MPQRILHIILVLFIFPWAAFPQTVKTGTNYQVVKGSQVALKVDAYNGDLQWQFSYDKNTWQNLNSQHEPTLVYTVDYPVYIRLGVKEFNCDWIYSDWVYYIPISLPGVLTNDLVNIGSDTVQYSAEVIGEGNGSVSKRGVCYAVTDPPSISNSSLENGSGKGFFWGIIKGLNANTTYFLRAFAENEAGLAYGNTVSFKTKSGLPTVETMEAGPVTQTSAILNGVISGNGGAEIETKGFCWGLQINPDLSGEYTDEGNGSGNFSSAIGSLNAATRYYFRAFAVNEAGIAFGQNLEFTTGVYLPSLSSCTVADIRPNTAQASAQLLNNGYGTITELGICWSTTTNPSINDHRVEGNIGTGQISQILNNLERNTLYYARAFASNQAGTAYGETASFTTLEGIPAVSTTSFSQRTDILARIHGSVTDTGESTLLATGICWSTAANPDLNSSFQATDEPSTEFNIQVLGLEPSTTYHFRAYATNEFATAYGEDLLLSTKDADYYTTEGTLLESTRNNFKGWSGLYPDYGSNGNGFSGVTHNWDENQIYIIGNNAKAIWVAHAPGSSNWSDASPGSSYIKTISLTGYDDPEAITYLGNGWVMIADEALREISFTKITSSTSNINKSSSSVIVDPTHLFNSSTAQDQYRRLEGIAYDFHNKIVYGLCEIGSSGHPRLFAWDWDFQDQKIDPNTQREVTDFFPGIRDNWSTGSDLHYSALLKRLYVVSGEDDIMAEYNCPHPDETGYGQLIGTRQLPRSNGSGGSNLGDCEGFCISKDGSYLFLCFENESFGYAPLPFVRYLTDGNLPSSLLPFQ